VNPVCSSFREESPCDIVVLDIVMLEMGGLDVLAKIVTISPKKFQDDEEG
jgi:response regulator RpfG family c-di-GMP phosphodiesterase